MTEMAQRLPVRIAALAGLVVGGISWLGGTSPWGCLVRVVAAMIVFGLLGACLRALLQQSDGTVRTNEHRGRHLDAFTPGMTLDDLGQDYGWRDDRGDVS